MLQQTQVATVIPYYERFLKRFPSAQRLAQAREEEVLRLWSGLGYYARGRNLHRAARLIAKRGFPRTAAAIAELPGVGRSTAAAIAVFAFGERAAILDTNVARVLFRMFVGAGDPKSHAMKRHLWALSDSLVPVRHVFDFNQALMDFGAMICVARSPKCLVCPMQKDCAWRRRSS
jgi:A/G-specific adenine glycosylase